MFDYQKIVLHWVNRLSFLNRKELSTLFRRAKHPISPEEWAILLVLWEKGAQSPSTLADKTVKDRTTVTRLIDAMVRKGLVCRTEDSNDRRRSVVELTDHGLGLKGELVPIAQSLIARSITNIPDEDLEITTRTLKAMAANLQAKALAQTDDKEAQNERL